MSVKVFIDAIEWKNGLGETPCTKEYREAIEARDKITFPYEDAEGHLNMNDMSPADYQAYNDAEELIGRLRLDGHVGQGERY